MATAFTNLQARLRDLAIDLEKAGAAGGAKENFGHALRLALRSPGLDNLFFVGDQPRAPAWGSESGPAASTAWPSTPRRRAGPSRRGPSSRRRPAQRVLLVAMAALAARPPAAPPTAAVFPPVLPERARSAASTRSCPISCSRASGPAGNAASRHNHPRAERHDDGRARRPYRRARRWIARARHGRRHRGQWGGTRGQRRTGRRLPPAPCRPRGRPLRRARPRRKDPPTRRRPARSRTSPTAGRCDAAGTRKPGRDTAEPRFFPSPDPGIAASAARCRTPDPEAAVRSIFDQRQQSAG